MVVDHNVPTSDRSKPNPDPASAAQIAYFVENARLFGIEYYDELDARQGICHVVGPEQGFTLPGTTIVCGDSHTSTHGAFGALALGIGTSETEHVLATQTLIQRKAEQHARGRRWPAAAGVTAKDLILAIIGEIGAAGATGHALEFGGEAVRALSMEGRMTICNMSVEAGARTGIIAPDEKTFEYLRGRPKSPKGALWDAAMRYWETLRTDEAPNTTARCGSMPVRCLRSSPGAPTRSRSRRSPAASRGRRRSPTKTSARPRERALAYMGLAAARKSPMSRSIASSSAHAPMRASRICARPRAWWKAGSVHPNVSAMVVPGSGLVKQQAEAEGLDRIFLQAGFDWREPGCSMCLAMNPDKLHPGERCASTSNRNFEGRQGYKGRTHLVSPAMAAAAAIAGRFVDVRTWGET